MQIQTTLAILTILTVSISAIVGVTFGATAMAVVALACVPSFVLAIGLAARQERKDGR